MDLYWVVVLVEIKDFKVLHLNLILSTLNYLMGLIVLYLTHFKAYLKGVCLLLKRMQIF